MSNGNEIIFKQRGRERGPLTRLISPEAHGQNLKPFVFLDFFDGDVESGFGFAMHPHSGIATLTWQPSCDVAYVDTSGKRGILSAGGLEWMVAGGGAWHQGRLVTGGHATGFQLWVPLPPEIEDGPSSSQYVPPRELPVMPIAGGEIKLLLGTLVGARATLRSPIDTHQDMNYMVVSLDAHSVWSYAPPASHDIGFAFVYEGEAKVDDDLTSREVLGYVLEGRPLVIAAMAGAVKVLIGSARKHPYPLILGASSVHTNEQSLRNGLERIRALTPR